MLAFDQSKMSLEKQRLTTRVEVEAKFYRLLEVIEAQRIFEEALKRNESQKESAKRRRSAGLASDADLLEFDLFESDLKGRLAQLKSEYEGLQAEFQLLLGVEDGGAAEYRPAGQLRHFHMVESLEDLKKRIPVESQSVIGAKLALEQAEAGKKVANGGFLPQLDLKATYGSRGINETVVSPETTVMGVARWEFFSGFDTIHARQEAAALAGKAEAGLRHAERSAWTSVETAYHRLKAVQERVDLEADNKAKAMKFFDVVSAEYRRGVKNSGDIRAASQMVLEVMIRDIRARAEFFEQVGVLKKAVGGEIKTVKGSEEGHVD